MEILKRFRRGSQERHARIEELQNRHKLNALRAAEFMERVTLKGVDEEIVREADSIFTSIGNTLADIAWIGGLRKWGVREETIFEYFTEKQNVADKMRNILREEEPESK